MLFKKYDYYLARTTHRSIAWYQTWQSRKKKKNGDDLAGAFSS
jgi:hypothetical protein